ncbi:MAG: nucleotide exchange factor GrpE [Sedimentisphaerales bacterium]|nr:nucleotide exchange factor GrpE [Sedimentisphaerales bacterium]
MRHKSKEKTQGKEKRIIVPEAERIEEPREELESLKKEKDELFEKLQRVSADYDNFQKRTSKQIHDTLVYEKERIIKTLLPALDNFEHTLAGAHSAEKVDVLAEGIRIIYEQMLDILSSLNVEQIKALGEQFDPSVHQAMMQENKPEEKENVVLKEFQKGYKLNGRVIRPSKVVVNKPQDKKQQDKQSDNDENRSVQRE